MCHTASHGHPESTFCRGAEATPPPAQGLICCAVARQAPDNLSSQITGLPCKRIAHSTHRSGASLCHVSEDGVQSSTSELSHMESLLSSWVWLQPWGTQRPRRAGSQSHGLQNSTATPERQTRVGRMGDSPLGPWTSQQCGSEASLWVPHPPGSADSSVETPTALLRLSLGWSSSHATHHPAQLQGEGAAAKGETSAVLLRLERVVCHRFATHHSAQCPGEGAAKGNLGCPAVGESWFITGLPCTTLLSFMARGLLQWQKAWLSCCGRNVKIVKPMPRTTLLSCKASYACCPG